MAGLQITIEIVLIGLLAATLTYAIRLERGRMHIKRDRAELEQLIANLDEYSRQADATAERLRIATDAAGRAMTRHMESSANLKDDLADLIERGERLSGQLGGAGPSDFDPPPRRPRPAGGTRRTVQRQPTGPQPGRTGPPARFAGDPVMGRFLRLQRPARVAPATIFVMALLLGLKLVGLGQGLTPGQSVFPDAQAAPAHGGAEAPPKGHEPAKAPTPEPAAAPAPPPPPAEPPISEGPSASCCRTCATAAPSWIRATSNCSNARPCWTRRSTA